MPKSGAKGGANLNVDLILPGEPVTQTGFIHSFDRGLLRIQTSRQFKELESLDVRIGSCHVPGEVLYSVEKGGSFRTAVSLLRGRNRRTDRRIPVSWRAHVAVMEEDPYSFDADVVDLSSSGFGLLSPREVHASARIAVETTVCVGFGEVLHCRPEADGSFRLGVRIEELIGSATPKAPPGPLKRLLRSFER